MSRTTASHLPHPVVHHRLQENEWQELERDAEFRQLYAEKVRFIVPATIFFIVYYFSLPILVGYAPGLMERKVVGNINLAYVYALSQFAMTWIVVYLYVRVARNWDARARRIIEEVAAGEKL